jgi:hypothetical protein
MEGKRIIIDSEDLLTLFPPNEGFLEQTYGRIRTGKTSSETLRTIDDLNRGQVCYNNWPINWNGYDERRTFWGKFWGLIGIKKYYKVYSRANFVFVDLTDLKNVKENGIETKKNFYDWLKEKTSCTIRLDEGHIYYDSYLALKMDINDRVAILDTGHMDRRIVIISQRPSAIHVVLRANVSRFWKCEPSFDMFGFKRITVTEFQDTKNDLPNDERIEINDPKTGVKKYGNYQWAVSSYSFWISYGWFGKAKVTKMYNHKYRRNNAPESQINAGELYRLSWWQSINNLFYRPMKVPIPPKVDRGKIKK